MRALGVVAVVFGVVVSSAVVGCEGAVGGSMLDEASDPADPAATDPGTEGDDAAPGEDSGTKDASSPSADAAKGTPDAAPPKDSGPPPSSTTDSGTSTPSDPPVSGMPLAANLGIREVAVYQGVKVSVAKDGAKVTSRSADVVAGREAWVRVFLTPKAGWTTQTVTGELTLQSSSGTKTYTATITPSASSSDASLASTLNFQVPTGAIAVDTKYAVTLYGKAGSSGDTSGARYPAGSSFDALDARSTGETLKVKIVPVQYDADGSGRLPDVSSAQVEQYRQAFYKMYPAKKVEITVRAPWSYPYTVSANGSGFSSLLQSVVKLRQTDGAPKDVYYYGAFNAKSSFSTYCSGGCVTGLCGLLTYPSDSSGRACVGVGYTGAQSAETAAHEVGHAHGRAHAPCGGVSDYDSKFPYSNGSIGAWGFDLIAKKLIDPSSGKDFMSYCSPEWVSDYTFEALIDRMAYVNGAGDVILPEHAPRTYRFVDVGQDGRLSWGDTLTLDEPPIGDPQTVTWEAPDGTALESATGSYYPYDDLPGGYMLVPEAPADAAALRIAGMPFLLEHRLERVGAVLPRP